MLTLSPKTKFIFVPVAMLFFWISFISTQEGGHNAMARFVTLHAISVDHSFKIDAYREYSMDWAQSYKDDHYYQNKAPGPVFVALLPYLGFDAVAKLVARITGKEHGVPGYFLKTLTSFSTQVIPFIFLVFLFWQAALKNGSDLSAQLFLLFALFFGTTTSFFFNSFFGHGMAAMFLLASFLLIDRKQLALSAFFFSMSCLSDYAACALTPLYLGYALVCHSDVKAWLRAIALGALIPMILWIWYHTALFGSPFSLPMSQRSPVFLATQASTSVWGVIGLLPSAQALKELLFGASRSVLVTQPWIYLVMLFLPLAWKSFKKTEKAFSLVTILGFVFLLYMNASFEGWHGGGTPGPRYLSVILPFFAIVALYMFPWLSKINRSFLWLGLIYSLIFHLLMASGSILVPLEYTVWGYAWGGVAELWRGSERMKLLVMSFASMLAVAVLARKGRHV